MFMTLNRNAYSFLLVGCIVGIAIASVYYFHVGKPEVVGSLWLGGLTLLFAFTALRFTQEKFRADLFDKRLEIYLSVLTFCSTVFSYGSLVPTEENAQQIREAHNAADKSFRSQGYHKSKALFGADIAQLFSELNSAYSYINTFGRIVNRTPEQDQRYNEKVMFVSELSGKLPDIFKPYMYFGHYKDWE